MQPATIKKISSLLPLMLTFASSQIFAGTNKPLPSIADDPIHYRPTINLAGFYGARNNSYGVIDALIPIAQHSDRSFFLDVRGIAREHPNREFNIGIAYRWLSNNDSKLYGVYGFFDRKRSPLNHLFNQMTLGAEWKQANWSIIANLYVPIGKTHQTLGDGDFAYAEPNGNNFILVYGDNASKEYALTGVDVQFGHTIPGIKHMRAYLGGFYFDHRNTKTIAGPRAQITYNIAPLLGKSLSWLDRLSIETSYQYDSVRKDVWYTGVRFSIPLGKRSKLPANPLYRDMTSFIRRDLDVVTEGGDKTTYLKSDGSPYVGTIVSTADELAAATAEGSGIDIIGVKNQIDVTGNTYNGNNTKAAVTLLEGQGITGLNYTLTSNGKNYTVKIVNNTHGVVRADPSIRTQGSLVLTGENTGNLLKIYTSNSGSARKHQVIRELTLTVPTVDSSDTQTVLAITNTTGNLSDRGNQDSFAYASIHNVDTNGIMAFKTEENQVGELNISNNTYTINNSSTGIGAIDIQSNASTDITIESISNNTFNITSTNTSQGVTGLSIEYLNGPVNNNTLSDLSAVSTGEVYGLTTKTITANGSFENNTFNDITATNDTAYAIKVDGTMDGVITNNSFDDLTSAIGNVYGVYINGDVAGKINNNLFSNITADSDTTYGIKVEGSLNGIIVNNTFNALTSSTDNVYGVYINGNIAGKINNNLFSNINAQNNTARGIYQSSGDVATILYNTLNVSGSNASNSIGISLPESSTENTSTIESYNYFGGMIEDNKVIKR